MADHLVSGTVFLLGSGVVRISLVFCSCLTVAAPKTGSVQMLVKNVNSLVDSGSLRIPLVKRHFQLNLCFLSFSCMQVNTNAALSRRPPQLQIHAQ